MIFYDKEGKPYSFNISKDDYFDYGSTSKVYRINSDECLKVMDKDSVMYFKEELYDEIKSLSLDSLVKLSIPFYQDGKIKAYTMEYLEKSKKSILDMHTEYLLDNLHSLYKDILVLAKHLIVTSDLYHRNIVIGDSGIKLIDFDGYLKMSFDGDILKQNILKQNIAYLLYAFKRLFQEELIAKGFELNDVFWNNMTRNKYLNYLFDCNGYKEEPAKVLERKMIGTKTPMELFDRKWNK